MRLQTSAGAAVAGLSLVLGVASSGVTNANPRPPVSVPQQAGRSDNGRQHAQLRRRADTAPAPCSTNYPGGFSFNAIAGAAETAGGDDSSVLGGYGNQVCDADDSIAGGYENGIDTEASGTAPYSFIGGGYANQVNGQSAAVIGGYENYANGDESVVAGGAGNFAEGTADFVGAGQANTGSASDSFVGAGSYNASSGSNSFEGAGSKNKATGSSSFLGAGDGNAVSAGDAFLGAGNNNAIAASAIDGVLAGGFGNSLTGQKATIGGGEANEVAGSFAVVPGGYHDEALGNESFAAGSQAEARYAGSFVWSDYNQNEKPQTDSAAGQFIARASGGVYFFSNAASSSGVHLAAGSGTWSSLSDRNAKTDIVPLDDASILAKVASLPISTWQYKTERGVRHVGPMAQDFYAAFGVGEDDRHITSIDEDGVALAAIKALEAQIADERNATNELRTEVRRIGRALSTRAHGHSGT